MHLACCIPSTLVHVHFGPTILIYHSYLRATFINFRPILVLNSVIVAQRTGLQGLRFV